MPAISLVAAALLVVGILITKRNKLSAFKGPVVASLTDFWEVWDIWSTRATVPYSGLDPAYGDIVRIGPNKLLFRKYAATRDIFSTNNNLRKSDHYPVIAPVAKGKPLLNFFASTDVAYHDRIRRLILKPFQLNSVTQHEHALDLVLNEFTEKIDKVIAEPSGRVLDLAPWSRFFASDAISKIVFGDSYGFIKAGSDFNNMIRQNTDYLKYHVLVGAAPWLDHILMKNPILLWLDYLGLSGKPNSSVEFAIKAQADAEAASGGSESQDSPSTILSEVVEVSRTRSDVLDNEEVLKICLGVVFAGGESVGAQLGAALYHLLQNPETLSTLQQELDGVSDPALPFSILRDLPYLEACVLEVMRMFPSNRAAQERVSPKDGMTVDGVFIPGGTVLSINPWIINRDASVFGKDVETFRPERWTECDDAKKRTMKQALANFGYGKYGCIGQHIAVLETTKFVATVVKRYNMRLARPEIPWGWELSEFVHLSNIHAELSLRT